MEMRPRLAALLKRADGRTLAGRPGRTRAPSGQLAPEGGRAEAPGMLTEIDRVLLATPDAETTAAKWRALLGAEEVSRDALPGLAARRLALRLGTSDIELLEPDGAGAV